MAEFQDLEQAEMDFDETRLLLRETTDVLWTGYGSPDAHRQTPGVDKKYAGYLINQMFELVDGQEKSDQLDNEARLISEPPLLDISHIPTLFDEARMQLAYDKPSDVTSRIGVTQGTKLARGALEYALIRTIQRQTSRPDSRQHVQDVETHAQPAEVHSFLSEDKWAD